MVHGEVMLNVCARLSAVGVEQLPVKLMIWLVRIPMQYKLAPFAVVLPDIFTTPDPLKMIEELKLVKSALIILPLIEQPVEPIYRITSVAFPCIVLADIVMFELISNLPPATAGDDALFCKLKTALLVSIVTTKLLGRTSSAVVGSAPVFHTVVSLQFPFFTAYTFAMF